MLFKNKSKKSVWIKFSGSSRMLKGSPKWNPGIQKGEPVRLQFTLRIQLNKKKELEKTDDNK